MASVVEYRGWRVRVMRVGTKGEYMADAEKSENAFNTPRIGGKGAASAAYCLAKQEIDRCEGAFRD